MSEPRQPKTTKRKAPRTAYKPGQSGNPGGQSKEKRAFLDRLRGEDAATIYDALMDLVREGNPHAVLRAFEYVAGKPPAAEEDRQALRDSAGILAGVSAEKAVALLRKLEET